MVYYTCAFFDPHKQLVSPQKILKSVATKNSTRYPSLLYERIV